MKDLPPIQIEDGGFDKGHKARPDYYLCCKSVGKCRCGFHEKRTRLKYRVVHGGPKETAPNE